jgi:hypothetical protein
MRQDWEIGDVVDKIYKPEYKWVLKRKNRYGAHRCIKEMEKEGQSLNSE